MAAPMPDDDPVTIATRFDSLTPLFAPKRLLVNARGRAGARILRRGAERARVQRAPFFTLARNAFRNFATFGATTHMQ